MRIGRVFLIGWNALLVGLCFYLMFCLVDGGLSLTYCRDGERIVKQDRDALRVLAVELARGTRRDAVRQITTTKFPRDQNHIVKEEGDVIFVVGVGLRFQDDALVAIEFANE
jgi:hypothetical protein